MRLVKNISKELEKFSKAALIKAIADNSIFRRESILISVRNAEFNIVQKKQDNILEKMSKLHPVHDYKQYKELDKKYEKYDKQIKKLLGL